MNVRTFAATLLAVALGASSAAADEVGRFQAIQLPGSSSDAVLILDTRDGHMWRVWQGGASTIGTEPKEPSVRYIHRLAPGEHSGQLQLSPERASDGKLLPPLPPGFRLVDPAAKGK
jgi:hypothetical protein